MHSTTSTFTLNPSEGNGRRSNRRPGSRYEATLKSQRIRSARFKTAVLIILIALSTQSSIAPAQAKEVRCNQSQKSIVKKHITKQITALANSDWQRAYSYSAKSFQGSITVDQFKEIIESGYLFLTENGNLTFGACRNSKNAFYQLLTVDSMGAKYELAYNLTLVGKRLGIVAVGGVKPPSEVAI